MKRTLCFLALSALSALGETGDGSGAPLRIYTEFQSEPVPAIESGLKQELAALVAPIGLRLDWKSLSAPRDGEVSAALVVVTFKGRCNVGGLEFRRMVPGGLAWTHINDGVILPFVDVDCDRIRDFVQSKLLQIEAKRREALLARAIARVLGHELYHVFGETTHHAKDGVGQPAFTSSELLSDNFDFAENEFRVLRGSKLAALLKRRKPAPTGKGEYVAEGCAACHGSLGQGTRFAPALRGPGKTPDLKALISRFAKRREDMYRRARTMNLEWLFPSDEQVRTIVTALGNGFDEAVGDSGSR